MGTCKARATKHLERLKNDSVDRCPHMDLFRVAVCSMPIMELLWNS